MYISTRGNSEPVTAAKAIYLGMAPKGGLFVPESIPRLTLENIGDMRDLDYPSLAAEILGLYLDDYSYEEIQECARKAYGDNFFHEDIAPLTLLEDQCAILELWHGPTAAFKDMALQVMPHLLSKAIAKEGRGEEVLILVATSGDTGKAALEGFKNIPGIRIAVFYPRDGVSKVQELQMTTTDGDNTYVIAVEGNFDDCQNGVKEIFSDEALNQLLSSRGLQLSSANSINWGRLCPQIAYYFYSYLSLLQADCLKLGDKVNFVVPTGNFGNILAAWYAKEMGLPIGKLICASNDNKVLSDFFHTGTYDRRREFHKTNSPSMDILISSNLERFLFEVSGHDSALVAGLMEDLRVKGAFTVEKSLLEKLDSILWAGWADEAKGARALRDAFQRYHYLVDTHTAVALAVYDEYREKTGDAALSIIDSTASPFKFAKNVMEDLGDETAPADLDELLILEALSSYTGAPVHPALENLDTRPVLHKKTIKKEEMKSLVKSLAEGTFHQ